MDWGSKITYLAKTSHKGAVVSFGIKDIDRLQHVAVIGRAGSGRAGLLTTMILQDVERGLSTIVIDAAGNLAPMLLERLDEQARERVIYLDPGDGEHPFSWNPVDEFRALGDKALPIFSDALASLYRVPASELVVLGAKFILQSNDASVLSFYSLVAEASAREKAFGKENNERAEFEAALQKEPDAVSSILEHGRYIAKDTLVRNLFGQTASKFSFGAGQAGAFIVMDISRIRMFPTRITPLVRMFAHAARARGILHESVAIYLQDCLKYLSDEDIEKIFPERTVTFTISDTAYSEEDRPIREKALERCASVIAFVPHQSDLAMVERMFYPYIVSEEFEKLDNGEFAIALTIDSVRARPFFARTLPPPERSGVSHMDIHVASKNKYTTPRINVDKLFRRKATEDKKGKDDEPGSFSDAFRSIFTKRAGDSTPAAAPGKEPKDAKNLGTAAKPKPPETKQTEKKETKNEHATPTEIPEEELRQMLYVGSLPA